MARDPKDTAAALLIGLKPKTYGSGAPAEEEGDDDADDGGFDAAATEAYDAAKADDPVAFSRALKSAIEICVSRYNGEE